MNVELITIISDGDPDIDDAVEVLKPFMPHKCVGFAFSASMAEENVVAEVTHDSREEIVEALTAAHFRIIEGGQL